MQMGGNGIGKSIIVALGEESYLTVKQLYLRVLRLERRPFSYQAVHKKIKILEQEGVLKKENNSYSLDPNWLKSLTSFAENALEHCKNSENKLEQLSISQIYSELKKMGTKRDDYA